MLLEARDKEWRVLETLFIYSGDDERAQIAALHEEDGEPGIAGAFRKHDKDELRRVFDHASKFEMSRWLKHHKKDCSPESEEIRDEMLNNKAWLATHVSSLVNVCALGSYLWYESFLFSTLAWKELFFFVLARLCHGGHWPICVEGALRAVF